MKGMGEGGKPSWGVRHSWQPFLLSCSALLMLETTDTILKSSLYNATARVYTPLRAPYNPVPQKRLEVYRTPSTSTPVSIRNRPPANQAGEGSQHHPRVHLQLSRGCHKRRTHTAHSGDTPQAPVSGYQGKRIALLGPTGHHLRKSHSFRARSCRWTT